MVENYLTGKRIACDPFIVRVLDSATEFLPREDVLTKFNNVSGLSNVIDALLENDLLLKKGTRLEKRDACLNAVWKWPHDAKFFHFATKEVNYTFDFNAIRKTLEQKSLHDPPPSPFKTTGDGFKIPLTQNDFPKQDFWETLFTRRTCRKFKNTSISKTTFVNFLSSVSGMTRYYNDSVLDKRIIKTSPSGGARHPIEVYPIIRNVQGIDPGIYHYEVETNSIVLLGKYPGEKTINKLFSGQYWVETAAVSFFFTAILPRSMWKYDHSRAYRVVMLDAGHIGQTFHLAGTALGLGVFTTAAIQDRKIEKFLQLDGIEEIVVYAGAIGNPEKE